MYELSNRQRKLTVTSAEARVMSKRCAHKGIFQVARTSLRPLHLVVPKTCTS